MFRKFAPLLFVLLLGMLAQLAVDVPILDLFHAWGPSARAENVIRKASSSALQGSAGEDLGEGLSISNAAVTCFPGRTVPVPDLSSEPRVVPFGAQAVITCASAQVYFFWTMADDSELTANSTTLFVTDANGVDGYVPGRTYNGGTMSMVNDQTKFGQTDSIGMRTNVCSAAGLATGRPCNDDTDCIGSETCTTTGLGFSTGAITGVYLCGQALGAAAVVCQVSFES